MGVVSFAKKLVSVGTFSELADFAGDVAAGACAGFDDPEATGEIACEVMPNAQAKSKVEYFMSLLNDAGKVRDSGHVLPDIVAE